MTTTSNGFDGQLAYAQAASAAFAPSASGIVVDFDEDYQPVNLVNPATAPQTYRVRTGDTLYSIAQQTWGDANLWRLIADANGLSAGASLAAGQTLTIPDDVVTIGHTNGAAAR